MPFDSCNEIVNKFYISKKKLHECQQLINELKRRLEKLGVREMIGENRVQLNDKEKGNDKIKMQDIVINWYNIPYSSHSMQHSF